VAFLIAGIISFIYYFTAAPYEQTIKIWTPDNYHIDNLAEENGQYTPLEKVKIDGTAMYPLFEEYQLYQKRENPKNNAVMIQKDGAVFYQTKENGKNYVAEKYYGLKPFMNARVTKITGDTIDITEEINPGAPIFIFIGLEILSLFAGAIVSGIIVVIITIAGYLKKLSGRKIAA